MRREEISRERKRLFRSAGKPSPRFWNPTTEDLFASSIDATYALVQAIVNPVAELDRKA